ncbi:MAG TPA: stage II sporulation protein M [Nitrosopumilus sp.]|nr:stage II sporulation protein M [Nitrosopumilus sp.]
MAERKRLLTFLIFVGLFTLSFWIGSMWDVPQEDAEAFLEEFQDLIEDIDGPGIFAHNAMIGLPMFIPGFGVAWGFFTSWQTGYAFAALVVTTPILAEIPAVALLYLSPFGLMELSAYALGMSRSFLLIHKIIKKVSIKGDAKVVGIEIGIVVGLLLAGGVLEAYMIETTEVDFEFGQS